MTIIQREKGNSLHSNAKASISSPFLDEQLYLEEADSYWEARMEALAAESLFHDTALLPEPQEQAYEWEGADTATEVETYSSEDENPLLEDETSDQPIVRMKLEFQTRNRIWRNDGKTSSRLKRKYGPDDFLVNQEKEGVRLESENDENGFVEFETEWFRTWPKLKKAIEKAIEMTNDMNKVGPSKFEKTRKAFPFNVDHLRRGTAKEKAQGFWDPRKGKENDKQKILGAQEELEVEIVDDKWTAAIQSSESLLLEYYESFLRQHEEPTLRDDTIQHAKAILDAGNTDGTAAAELVKLHSFLQIIVNYILRGQRVDVKGKPSKFAFWLMNRTNFASIYRWLLTDKEKKLFQKIVNTDAIIKELGLDRQTPFFKNGYGEKRHEAGPTIRNWLSQILKGVDLLSGEQSGNGLSAAMGKYRVETSRGKKDSWLVKFETRGTVMGRVHKAKDWVKYASDLFDLASKRERDVLKLAHQGGMTDENRLTNLIFHARHPELKYRRIRRSEQALAQEWLQIRDELVRPLLQGTQPELETFEDIPQEFEGLPDSEFQFDWTEGGDFREAFIENENPVLISQEDGATEVDLHSFSEEGFAGLEYEDLLLVDSETAIDNQEDASPTSEEDEGTLQGPLEERPTNPVPETYVPSGAKRIQVETGQSWVSMAQNQGIVEMGACDNRHSWIQQ